MSPQTKAWTAVVVFALAGVVMFATRGAGAAAAVPHAVFYALLVLNTFFSVRFFTPLVPNTTAQGIFDAVLACTYLALAFFIGNSSVFPVVALTLFIVACAKYAQALGYTEHDHVLRKKITINMLGAALCAAALAATLLQYEVIGAWAMAGVFGVANAYLLLIRPMYRL